ncbi:MAG: tetratricopeptide repeat protein [Acidobacteria bacterium]|nr:tetratricopeptide repeat protein [Acidobacteriota bacterium]
MFSKSFISILILLVVAVYSNAQVDDVSEATGLPLPIGAPVIYGQVSIANLPKGQRKPTVWVYLFNGGAQIDKRQTHNDYYYFLQAPRNGQTIVFEVDNREAGRFVVSSGISNRLRQDVTIDWRSLYGDEKPEQPGVVSARDGYSRSPENEKLFSEAVAQIKKNELVRSAELFTTITKADEKDHIAFMMLGTVLMTQKNYADARTAFERAIALKPDYEKALTNYGSMVLGQKDFGKAEELLKRAVEADPKSADANHYLGETYLQTKRGSLAVGYLNKAIEFAPIEKAGIHLRLAALYDAAGLKPRAAEEYKAFLEKVKDHPDRQRFIKYIEQHETK